MIKAVLFDLDGTLLNRESSVLHFIRDQYDRLHEFVGHIPKEKYVRRFIELEQHGYVWKDRVYQQMGEELGLLLTWEELLEDYITYFKNHCVPFQGLEGMFQELKQLRLSIGMITNGFGSFQMANIKALGIESAFDVILISEWEGLKKPNPELFHRALNQLNCEPDEAVYIGDHFENDIQAAEAVGMTGIWMNTGANQDQFTPNFSLDRLKDLPKIIKGLNR